MEIPDIHERVAVIEARCGVIVPDMKARIEKIEENAEKILTEVITVKTMLQKNAFCKGKSNGTNIEILKLQTKVSRWINGILIAGICIILAFLGLVLAIVK